MSDLTVYRWLLRLCDPEGYVDLDLQFGKQGRLPLIEGHVAAQLVLECQCCLGPMEWNIDSKVRLGIVESVDAALLLPEDTEALIVEPDVEVIVGRRLDKGNGSYFWAKSPRTLHADGLRGDAVLLSQSADGTLRHNPDAVEDEHEAHDWEDIKNSLNHIGVFGEQVRNFTSVEVDKCHYDEI